MLVSDLHVHLDGSFREETLVGLAVERVLEPDESRARDLARRLRFGPAMSLGACLERFHVTTALLQTSKALERVASELVRDSYLDGVRHLEVRLCPALHAGFGLTGQEIVESVLAGMEDGAGRAAGDGSTAVVTAGLVLAVLEGMSAEEAADVVDLAAGYAESGVLGIDLAGDEALFDAARYAAAFGRARDAGLGVTVHAGEGHEAAHIRDAVETLGAERIGHGTTVLDSPGTADLVAERGVTLEVCLTSSVHTGAARSVAEHPLPRMLAAGLRVTLATDNRFLSATTLSREYDLAASELALDRRDLDRMAIESASSSFLPEPERARLESLVRASVGQDAPPERE